MLQTRKPFCRLFIFQIQIQYRYTPDAEVIMSFIQILIQLQLRYAPDTVSILSLILTLSSAHRCSRHGCHFIAYSDFRFRYNIDTLQTRKSLCYSFNIETQLQLGYTPDADAIPLLIQIQSPDTFQIRSKRGYHSDTHSFDLQHAIQQTILDGIFNPISNKIHTSKLHL